MAETFAVAGLRDPCLRLRRPVTLRVYRERDGRVVVVYPPWNYEYAVGAYLTQAVERWQGAAAESYWWFRDTAASRSLGPHLVAIWRRMQAGIEERVPAGVVR